LVFLFCIQLSAQLKFDSIHKVVNTKTSITEKIDTFYFAFHRRKLSKRETASLKEQLMKLAKQSGQQKGIAMCHYRFAWIDYYQNKFNEAITEFFQCLKIAEELKDSSLIGNTNTEIADAYVQIRNLDFARRHLYFAFSYLNPDKKSDRKVIDLNYGSMSSIYKDKGQIDSALRYAKLRMEYAEKCKSRRFLAGAYTNFALAYKKAKDFDKALFYLEKNVQLKEEMKDSSGLASALVNLANTYHLKGDDKKAMELCEKGVAMAYRHNNSSTYKNGLSALGDIYFTLKEYKKAAENLIRFDIVKDSLYRFEMDKQLNELTSLYQTNKKDAELTLKEQEIKTSKAENSKQRVMIIASGIALVLAFIAIFFIYRSFQQNKRNSKILSEKNHEIEEKQKEIIDSIKYAKRIQMAHLPSEKMVENSLKKIRKT
jgi:tetratricopeptide (TPR) repeat protein